MEIFDGLEKFLKSSFHLPRSNGSRKNLKILWHIVILSALLGLAVSSFWFIFFHEKTFTEIAKALYTFNSSIVTFVNMLWFIYNRSFFYQLIDDSRSIIRKRCENPASKKFYEKVNKSIEKWTAMIIISYIQVTWTLGVFLPVALSCISYFLGKSGGESIELALPGVFPYRNTFVGYLFGVTVQFVGAYGILLNCSLYSILLLFGWNISAFVDDIELNLNDLTLLLSIRDNSLAFDRKIQAQFREFLQLQMDTRRFSKQFLNKFKNITLGYLLWSTLCICCSLIILEKSISSMPYMDFTQIILFIFWAFLQTLILCQMGETITDRLQDVGEALYQTTWYLLPIRIQKAMPILLMIAEKPIYLEAFGSISCRREMYQKSVNKAFSFFMVMRQFEF